MENNNNNWTSDLNNLQNQFNVPNTPNQTNFDISNSLFLPNDTNQTDTFVPPTGFGAPVPSFGCQNCLKLQQQLDELTDKYLKFKSQQGKGKRSKPLKMDMAQIIKLHDVDNISISDLAKINKISVSTLRSRIKKYKAGC